MEQKPWYSQEQKAKQYEMYYQTKYRRADEWEKSLIKNLLERFDGSHTILEVGCGTGHFTRWMNSLSFESCGLDSSTPMLKEAKKLCTDACLIKADSSCLPFRPNSFDLVVFIFSLEFMANVARVFAETERVARKGIIIGLINKWSFTAKRRIIQSRTAANSYYKNARFYSLPEIRNILEKSLYRRFRILKWETTVFPLIFGNSQSKVFPFGSFLGIAIELDDEHV